MNNERNECWFWIWHETLESEQTNEHEKSTRQKSAEGERPEWAKRNAINIFMHGNYSVNRGSNLWLTKSSTSITIIIKQTANDEIYAKCGEKYFEEMGGMITNALHTQYII